MKNILNKPVDVRLALALYVLFLVLGAILLGVTSCKTEKHLAAENERRRQEHIALLEETRKQYPCDTARVYSIDTLLQFITGDTVKIGEIAFVHDTLMMRRTITKFVLDSAWLQQYRDSLAAANYAFDIARQDAAAQSKRADNAEGSLKASKEGEAYYRRIVNIGGVVIGLLIGGFVALKLFRKI